MRFMYPARDWYIGLVCAGVIALCGAGYAGVMFVAGLQVLDAPVLPAGEIRKAYSHENVSRVLKEYEERERQFETFRETLPLTVPMATQPVSDVPTASSSLPETPSEDAVAEDTPNPVE